MRVLTMCTCFRHYLCTALWVFAVGDAAPAAFVWIQHDEVTRNIIVAYLCCVSVQDPDVDVALFCENFDPVGLCLADPPTHTPTHAHTDKSML